MAVTLVAWGCGPSPDLVYEQAAWCTLDRWTDAVAYHAGRGQSGSQAEKDYGVQLAVLASITGDGLALVAEPAKYSGTRDELTQLAAGVHQSWGGANEVEAVLAYGRALVRLGIDEPSPRCAD